MTLQKTKCDLCGNNSHWIDKLREIYQTKDIKNVCDICEQIINKKLSKIQRQCLDKKQIDRIPILMKSYLKGLSK